MNTVIPKSDRTIYAELKAELLSAYLGRFSSNGDRMVADLMSEALQYYRPNRRVEEVMKLRVAHLNRAEEALFCFKAQHSIAYLDTLLR